MSLKWCIHCLLIMAHPAGILGVYFPTCTLVYVFSTCGSIICWDINLCFVISFLLSFPNKFLGIFRSLDKGRWVGEEKLPPVRKEKVSADKPFFLILFYSEVQSLWEIYVWGLGRAGRGLCCRWGKKRKAECPSSLGLPQQINTSWWVETTEMYFPTVLETRNSKSRLSAGLVSPGGLEGKGFLPLF